MAINRAQLPASKPGQLPAFWASIISGLGSFKEKYFASNWEGMAGADHFGDYQARRLRYDTYWAHFENNVYRKLRSWSEGLKSSYQLYSYTRSIYSPAYRLGEFWASHILGGTLDPGAGDGKAKPSCLPILIPDDAEDPDRLRRAIAQLWADSNWQATKETWTRFGSVLGDVGLMVVDDPARMKVYLRVIHPRTIVKLDRDPFGNVKGYVLEERRRSPFELDPFTHLYVTYTEVAERQGESVVFSTFLDGQPFDWRDYPDESTPRIGPTWSEPYGFIPFVFTQHRDMGLGYGWSELHPAISKLHEIDDLASKLDDQIRKLVECPWFFAGVGATDDVTLSNPDGESGDDETGRTRIPSYYATDPNAKAMAMVAQLDIGAVSAHIGKLLENLERDHPELKAEEAGANASGSSRRIERERIERNVNDRRATYYDSIVRAHRMAIDIGAKKGYPGYEGFSENPFHDGQLDHSIGDNPVFAVDEMDRLAEYAQRSTVFKTYIDGGMPMEWAAKLAGIPDEIVKLIVSARDKEANDAVAMDVKRQAGLMAGGAADGGTPGSPSDKGLTGGGNAVGQVEKPPGLVQ